MTEPTCQICHKNAPADGFQVCDTCKGFDPLATRIEIDPTAKPIGHCSICGADGFEPYKIGKATVTSGICHACLMRKKYGPDWVPGGNVAKRKEHSAKYREKKKTMKQTKESGKMLETENDLGQKEQAKKEFVYPPVTIRTSIDLWFLDDDVSMYRKIQAIATKERRTLEQQVLYLLDGVLERTVV